MPLAILMLRGEQLERAAKSMPLVEDSQPTTGPAPRDLLGVTQEDKAMRNKRASILCLKLRRQVLKEDEIEYLISLSRLL